MRQILTVTTAATDLHLLTVDERRSAAGISDSSQDANLDALSLQIAAAISTECNVEASGTAVPTLKQETLTETFRAVCAPSLVLARRHAVTITSVTVDGTLLDPANYETDPESGIVYRLSNDIPCNWYARKVVVVYQAGFATVPSDLKMAASDFLRLAWQEKSRDPSLKSEEIEIDGIERTKRDFWVGSVPGGAGEGAVPAIVSGQLQRYRNILV